MNTTATKKRGVRGTRPVNLDSTLAEITTSNDPIASNEKVIRKLKIRTLQPNPNNSRPIEGYILQNIHKWILDYEIGDVKLIDVLSKNETFELSELTNVDTIAEAVKRSKEVIENRWKAIWRDARTIPVHGLIDPITVRRDVNSGSLLNSKDIIYHGHRRTLACIIAGLEEIDGIVEYNDPKEDLFDHITQIYVSNNSREGHGKDNLSRIEEYKKFVFAFKEKHGKEPSQRELSKATGMSKTEVAELSQLTKALDNPNTPDPFVNAVANNEVSISTASKVLSKSKRDSVSPESILEDVERKGVKKALEKTEPKKQVIVAKKPTNSINNKLPENEILLQGISNEKAARIFNALQVEFSELKILDTENEFESLKNAFKLIFNE